MIRGAEYLIAPIPKTGYLLRGGTSFAELSQNPAVLMPKSLCADAGLAGETVEQPKSAARNHKVKLRTADVAAYVGSHYNHPFPLNSPVVVICTVFTRTGESYFVARAAPVGRVCRHKAVGQISADGERDHIPASEGVAALTAASVLIACCHYIVAAVALLARVGETAGVCAPGTALLAAVPVTGHPPVLRVCGNVEDDGKQHNGKERLFHVTPLLCFMYVYSYSYMTTVFY
jgi:hypothetical protein